MNLTEGELGRSIICPWAGRVSKGDAERDDSRSRQKQDLRFSYSERLCL